MRIEVLGPLVVRRDGFHVPLQTGLGTAVLCWLVANADEPVGYPALAAAVGLEDAGGAARARTAVRRLHAQLGEHIAATSTHASIGLAPGELDVADFVALTDSATARLADHRSGDQIVAAREDLTAALALWRGDPYPDLASSLSALPVITELVQRHHDAVEDLFGLRLHDPVGYDLVADLRAEATRSPDRPRLQRQLATALYRTGRQVEALQVLAECTNLSPDAETAALREAVLRHDPALEVGEYGADHLL